MNFFSKVKGLFFKKKGYILVEHYPLSWPNEYFKCPVHILPNGEIMYDYLHSLYALKDTTKKYKGPFFE